MAGSGEGSSGAPMSLALDPEPVLQEYGNVMLGREIREGLE